jgi:hypothetical protein
MNGSPHDNDGEIFRGHVFGGGTLWPIRKLPYPNETWEEVADHQLDHDPTPAQITLHERLTHS